MFWAVPFVVLCLDVDCHVVKLLLVASAVVVLVVAIDASGVFHYFVFPFGYFHQAILTCLSVRGVVVDYCYDYIYCSSHVILKMLFTARAGYIQR